MTTLGTQIYKTPPLDNPLTVAKIWLSRGWKVLPVQPGNKRIVKGYGPTLGAIGGEDELDFWFSKRGMNLAVVAPESFVILDFDSIELFQSFAASWPEMTGSYCESTPGGGRHLFLHLDRGKLALPPLVQGIEVKRFCLVYPSMVNGKKYEVLEPGAILMISTENLEIALFPYLAQGDKHRPSPAAHVLSLPEGKIDPKNAPGENPGLFAKVKAAWPITGYLAFFEPKVKLKGEGRWRTGLCPWHDDHTPSLWVDAERGLFGCHSCGFHGDVLNWHARRLGTNSQKEAALDLQKWSKSVRVAV